MGLRTWLASRIYKRKTFLDPTKNYSVIPRSLIRRFTGKKIINIGAGKERLGKEVITIDRFETADILGDAQSLPIKSSSTDLVLSIAVLEHLKEPAVAVGEMNRVLRKGGEVYIEIPFLQP